MKVWTEKRKNGELVIRMRAANDKERVTIAQIQAAVGSSSRAELRVVSFVSEFIKNGELEEYDMAIGENPYAKKPMKT